MLEDLGGRSLLDDFTLLHDEHSVGKVGDNGQIVGDEYIGEAEGVPKAGEQTDNLSLNGDIEGGHRLVAYDDFRLEGQRSSNRDALALTAGKLMGVTAHMFRMQPNLLQQ